MDYCYEQIELKKLFDYYMSLANSGNGFAQSYIAEAFFWGWGCQQDNSKFIEWDTMAARNGSIASSRRMFLYYYSIGNLEAAGTLYLINGVNTVVPGKGHIWDVSGFVNFYNKYNNIQLFLDAYEGALDVSEDSRNNYKEYRKDAHKMFRAICSIYGFGIGQNLNTAVDYLTDIDYSDELFDWKEDCVHYILSLYEKGCVIDSEYLQSITEKIYLKNMIVQEDTAGCYIRHAMRLALLGNEDAAYGLGHHIWTKSDDDRRKYFFHDDSDALFWLSFIAEKQGNACATIEAIRIAADTQNVAFNYDYAKKICYYALNNRNYDRDFNYTVIDDGLVKTYAVRALVQLAIWINDKNEKYRLANDALTYLVQQANKSDEDRDAKHIGLIYCEVYKDYKQALPWLEEAASDGWDVQEYINKCKLRGGGKISSLITGLFSKKIKR